MVDESMELKDVILSTLAEIEEISSLPEPLERQTPINETKKGMEPLDEPSVPEIRPIEKKTDIIETVHVVRDDEARMLEGIRERLLVLFEGFQSPNNTQIEAKVDLTLNFFEYLLATIDNRLETIKES
jgi:hypothetical protein